MQSEFLLGVISDKDEQPSIFELYIMDSIRSMIKPAFRHVTNAISSQMSIQEYFAVSHESIYSAFYSYLDAYHLILSSKSKFVSGEFMESLYGMQRISAQNSTEGIRSISYYQKILSVVYIIIIPKVIMILQDYKRRAVNEEYSRSGFRLVDDVIHSTLCFLQKGIPYWLFFEKAAILAFRLLYTLKWTEYHDPYFALIGMKLVKSHTINDQSQKEPVNSSKPKWPLKLIFSLIFLMRGVDWIVNNDFSSDHLLTRVNDLRSEAPPPPPPPEVARGGIKSNATSGTCPLCFRRRENSCVISSGYAFCYLCILEEVRENGRCPITQMPCSTDDFVRLYENDII